MLLAPLLPSKGTRCQTNPVDVWWVDCLLHAPVAQSGVEVGRRLRVEYHIGAITESHQFLSDASCAQDHRRSEAAIRMSWRQTGRTDYRPPTADGAHLGVRFLAPAPVRTRSILFASAAMKRLWDGATIG
jgi:hypothetical protein